MRVPGYRVGPFDAVQFVAQQWREQTTASPGGVDMQPHVVLCANISNRVDGVECAQDSCSAGAVDIKRPVALFNALLHQQLKLFRYHSASLIARDIDYVVDTEAASCACTFARVMALER